MILVVMLLERFCCSECSCEFGLGGYGDLCCWRSFSVLGSVVFVLEVYIFCVMLILILKK